MYYVCFAIHHHSCIPRFYVLPLFLNAKCKNCFSIDAFHQKHLFILFRISCCIVFNAHELVTFVTKRNFPLYTHTHTDVHARTNTKPPILKWNYYLIVCFCFVGFVFFESPFIPVSFFQDVLRWMSFPFYVISRSISTNAIECNSYSHLSVLVKRSSMRLALNSHLYFLFSFMSSPFIYV